MRPADAATYRIAVTRLDQDSADLLVEIGDYLPQRGLVGTDNKKSERFRSEVDDHWRYSRAATVASGSIEMQRILLARTLLEAA